jgi:hypothetical protein
MGCHYCRSVSEATKFDWSWKWVNMLITHESIKMYAYRMYMCMHACMYVHEYYDKAEATYEENVAKQWLFMTPRILPTIKVGNKKKPRSGDELVTSLLPWSSCCSAKMCDALHVLTVTCGRYARACLTGVPKSRTGCRVHL